ncbi:glycoside hydrolase family 3 N-terminal domain-containing protein [Paraburkholderia sp. DGU8]|uniref:glycoside hydrolase family 3 N-terminal domain-containing protein n=1 Tax=Paraburkholderia sp. DGU8 TaxID=3161997 RepID=UPI003465A005
MKIERTKPTATAGKLKAIAILVQALCVTVAYAAVPPPVDAPTMADQRADALIQQMTQDELIQLVHGLYGRYAKSPLMPSGNDQEANRFNVSSNIDWGAARESDLLAFELAIEKGDPGSVMCSYNKVNTVWACSSDMLLNRILKHDWNFKGYVMSDWGAVHDIKDALNGLDQESGESFDKDNGGPFFGDKLKQALADGTVPESRLKDMAHRILRTMYAKGVFDNPPALRPIDVAADAAIAQADEEEGIVLLKNAAQQLPLAAGHTMAVIGSHADAGVLSGGGSSQVWPVGGPAVAQGGYSFPNPVIYDPSSPLKAIGAKAGSETRVAYDDGADPARAAELAKHADVDRPPLRSLTTWLRRRVLYWFWIFRHLHERSQ